MPTAFGRSGSNRPVVGPFDSGHDREVQILADGPDLPVERVLSQHAHPFYCGVLRRSLDPHVAEG